MTFCLLAACAPTRAALPSGSGTPFPGFAAAYTQATTECRGVTTMSASLGLSGKAGGTKLRGRIDIGLAAPAQIRLEGFPPLMFGARPIFTLVSRGDQATLLFNGRVLRGATSSAIIEALAGVALEPDELRSVLAGCGLAAAEPSNGRAFANGWAAVDAGATTVFLRTLQGLWRVVAVTRAGLAVEYSDFQSGRSVTVRIRTDTGQGGSTADIVLRLSQVELNTSQDARVFELDVLPGAVPITLDDLRRAGPLGGR